jgi:hypothetical protein
MGQKLTGIKALSGKRYLENGLVILINELFTAGTLVARFSLAFRVLPAANVSNIMIKTGTSNNRNGDVLANFFIVSCF